MKKWIRLISVIAALACALSMSGCGEETDSSSGYTGDLPAAELKIYMYTYSQEAEDTSLVMDEINQILKQKINATIEYNLEMVEDAKKKIPLMLASGENYDGIAMPADVYLQEVQKGGLLEIGDMLEEYMPQRMQTMTDYDFTEITYEGKIYALPGGFQWFTPQGYMIRGDLRKKYDIPEVTDLDGLQVYMDTLMEKEPGVIPFNTSIADNINFVNNFLGAAGWVSLGSNELGYYLDDETPTLCYSYETEEYRDFLAKTKEFADKGYWSKNAYAAKTISRDGFVAGTSFVGTAHVVNANDSAIVLKEQHPDWEVEFVTIPDKTLKRPTKGRSFTIPKTAKNPERLIMACELFGVDPDLNALLEYGIKDVHYTVNADGTIKSTEAGASRYPADAFPLVWNNRDLSLYKQVEGGIPELMEVQEHVDELSIIPPHSGFVLKTDEISSEVAAMNNVITTMKGVTNFGMFDSPEAVIEEYKSKMDTAGAEKVKAEAQRQLDAFLANQ